MAEPASRRPWLILVVVAVAALVVIAKTSAKHKAGPRPRSQTAQLPAKSPVGQTAAAVPADSTKVGCPEPVPAAGPPADNEPQTTPDPPPKSASPKERALEPEPEPEGSQPSAPSAADVKPQPPPSPQAEPPAPKKPAGKEVQPFPGSKLAECLQSGRPTLVDFGAGWCKACKMMEPVLVDAATKYEGKANVVYVDTDTCSHIARRYRISAIPAQIVFDAQGEKVSQHIGYWPIEDIDKQLAEVGLRQ